MRAAIESLFSYINYHTITAFMRVGRYDLARETAVAMYDKNEELELELHQMADKVMWFLSAAKHLDTFDKDELNHFMNFLQNSKDDFEDFAVSIICPK